MRPVAKLWVVYDAACGLCTGVRDWMGRQPAFIPLDFVATGSREAERRFPTIPPGELAVIGDTGEVWIGNGAWIVCLWALRGYREFAFRLSSPLLIGLAREAFSVLSRNRKTVADLLRMRSEQQIEQELRKVVIPRCLTERR